MSDGQPIRVQSDANLTEIIQSGWQFSYDAAIDFTTANVTGHGNNHCIGEANRYYTALEKLTKLFEQYNEEGNFAMWGFGGQPKPQFIEEEAKKEVSHCFALNGDMDDPMIGRSQFVCAEYRKITNGDLVEPKQARHFSEILKTYLKYV